MKKTPNIEWDAQAEILRLPNNPTPDGGQFGVMQCNGVRLRGAVWAGVGNKGTILLLGGYTEFLEKYFETISDLLQAGFGVAFMEWRGHGASTRALAKRPYCLHLQDFDDNIADLEAWCARVLAHLPQPHFGLAHSMGGQVALRFVQNYPQRLRGLALSAPMLGLPLPSFLTKGLAGLGGLMALVGRGTAAPFFASRSRQAGRIAKNNVTTDKARFLRNENLLQKNPAMIVSQFSWDWYRSASKAMRESAKAEFLQSIATPVWIGIAGEDKIVSKQAQSRAVQCLPNGSQSLFAKARHEILQEKNAIRNAFLREVLQFYSSI